MVSSTWLCLVLLHVVGVLGFPATLKLERSFPTNHGIELKQLTERDGLRHHRILHQYTDPNVVVGFGVYGTYDRFDAGFAVGVFWEKLSYLIFMLGFPAKEYYVVIDTGSDLLWSVANPVNLSLHHPHYKTKDVLQNPTNVQITNPPTISTMEMVVEHQL
ncbi:hypothetical protein Lser_V15G03850 [Lactuca serriola]